MEGLGPGGVTADAVTIAVAVLAYELPGPQRVTVAARTSHMPELTPSVHSAHSVLHKGPTFSAACSLAPGCSDTRKSPVPVTDGNSRAERWQRTATSTRDARGGRGPADGRTEARTIEGTGPTAKEGRDSRP
ncbi:hypothetical protein TPA0909_08890 [Streptomyces albus]|nr:hypothetical protein TPA0909_08890 [Streptomyces albus]